MNGRKVRLRGGQISKFNSLTCEMKRRLTNTLHSLLVIIIAIVWSHVLRESGDSNSLNATIFSVFSLLIYLFTLYIHKRAFGNYLSFVVLIFGRFGIFGQFSSSLECDIFILKVICLLSIKSYNNSQNAISNCVYYGGFFLVGLLNLFNASSSIGLTSASILFCLIGLFYSLRRKFTTVQN